MKVKKILNKFFKNSHSVSEPTLQASLPVASSSQFSNSVPSAENVANIVGEKGFLGLSQINTKLKDRYDPIHQVFPNRGVTPLEIQLATLVNLINDSIRYCAEILDNGYQSQICNLLDNPERFKNSTTGKLLSDLSNCKDNLLELKSHMTNNNDVKDVRTIDSFIEYAEAYANQVLEKLLDNANIKDNFSILQNDYASIHSPNMNKM